MKPETHSPVLFVEHLTVIDCAYLCETHGLVGESWICDVELSGALDDASMIMDFALVKKTIKRAIDNWVDHTLIVPTNSPNLTLPLTQPSALEGARTSNSLSFTFSSPTLDSRLSTLDSSFTLTHSSPSSALCLLPAPEVNAKTVATYLEARLKEILPATVTNIAVNLRNEPTDAPYFHYVHGLKKHDGNCQRIAHGHRSRIRIERGGAYDATLSAQWAHNLNYAYIATHEDIASVDATHTHFSYNTAQGAYALSYPTALCHFMDSDSTIECIAAHIAAILKAENPADRFTVRAYEGVMKGAVAQS